MVLLTVAVATSTALATLAFNVAPVTGNAEFGTADHFIRLTSPQPDTLDAQVAAAAEWFGTIDAIGHRQVPIPGSVDNVDHRTQDPNGPFGAPMLALVEGRFAASPTEIAVTDDIASRFALSIGATFDLDRVERTVVGVVENPSDLDDEFAHVTASRASPTFVTVLVDAADELVNDFRPPGSTSRETSSRGDVPEDVLAAVGVLAAASLALFLVALVAAASFLVMAQRRLRQLGMLAAIGATESNCRLVTVSGGAVMGVVAALAGAGLGIAGWVAMSPQVEAAAGYRIDAANVPWWLVIVGMALAVVAATGAAWWPARSAARIPIVLALSGRPPRPASARRSAMLAAAFVAGGFACLAAAGDLADDTAVHWGSAFLVVLGSLAMVIGVLLFSPLAVAALARAAAPLPVALRIALRDLGRYQARSGAALAAISLVLGIPSAIVLGATAAQHGADAGNLSDRQVVVRDGAVDGPFAPLEEDVAGLEEQVADLAELLPTVSVQSLDVALDPAAPEQPEFDGRIAVSLAERSGDGWRDLTLLYVATPELLAPYGLDVASLDAGTGFATTESGEIGILGAARPPEEEQSNTDLLGDPRPLEAGYSSVPGSFLTHERVQQQGWESIPSGRWLLELDAPLTDDQLAAAEEYAAGAGLTIESRDHQEGLSALRAGATAVGMLVALGVLALTVGLVRSEAASDLRILTATGATRATRRMLTATTAGGLALLGVLLGTGGAYLVLLVGFLDGPPPFPASQLVAIAGGTPLVAAVVGGLLTGREPPPATRAAIG